MKGDFAGGLRERVTLLRRGPERDALGGAVGDWESLRTAWAAVVPIGRREIPRWRVMLRSNGAIPEVGDRLEWGTRTLRVVAVGIDPTVSERWIADTEEER